MKTCDLTFEFVDNVFMYYVNVVSLVTPWLERNEFEDIKSSYAHPKNIILWEQLIKSFRNVSFRPLNQSELFMPVFSCDSVYTFIRKSLHLLESMIIRSYPETRFRPDFLRMLALLPDRDCISHSTHLLMYGE